MESVLRLCWWSLAMLRSPPLLGICSQYPLNAYSFEFNRMGHVAASLRLKNGSRNIH